MSPLLMAENGLACCMCNAHCRRVQSLNCQYATFTPQYHIDARNFTQLCHCCLKGRLVTMVWPTFIPKTAHFPSTNSTPIQHTYPLTDPTHHSKHHPDPISRFSMIHHQSDRQTDKLARQQLGSNTRLHSLY